MMILFCQQVQKDMVKALNQSGKAMEFKNGMEQTPNLAVGVRC